MNDRMISLDEEQLLQTDDINRVKIFLINSFDKKSKGQSFEYDQIVRQLRTRDDHETLWRIYIALANCVSYYSKKLVQLVIYFVFSSL